MSPPPYSRRRELMRVMVAFAIAWPVFGAVTAILSAASGAELSASFVVARVLFWSAWSLLTPLVVLAADRHRFVKGRRLVAFGVHAFGVLATGLVQPLIYVVFEFLSGADESFGRAVAAILPSSFRYASLNYTLVFAAVTAVRNRRIARRSALARARLERRLAAWRLETLAAGLGGESAFETLDRIAANIRARAADSETQLLRFSTDLRARLRAVSSAPPGLRSRPLPTPPSPIVTAFFVYLGFAVYLTLLGMQSGAMTGELLPLRDTLLMIACYAAAGVLSYVEIVIGRHIAREQGGPWRVAVLLLAGAAWIGVHGAVIESMSLALGRPPGRLLTPVVMLSMLMLGLAIADELSVLRLRARLRSQEIAQMLVAARTRSVTTQLAPHFLFNALNSVLSLVRRDPDGAVIMIGKLRRLLELTTTADERELVPLREELAIIDHYLDIERVRFRDALEVSVAVGRSCEHALVPPFLLQPLVENAVHHGSLATVGRGFVKVEAGRDGSRLTIEVINDGELLDAGSWREGIGLSSVRRRLEQLYGGDHELTVSGDDEAVRVRIVLPLRFDDRREVRSA